MFIHKKFFSPLQRAMWGQGSAVLLFTILATSLFAQEIEWVQSTGSAGWSARIGHTTVAFDNKIWVLGGKEGYTYYKDVWYSTDGANWTKATDLPGWSKKAGHTSVVFQNKMWVIGGVGGGVAYNDVWYSTNGVNWTKVTSSADWSARAWHASVVFDDKMWVLGGVDANNKVYNDVWYSTDGENWTKATDSAGWSVRMTFGSTVFDNKIWMLGGYDGSCKNDVWYSANGGTWTKETGSAGWSARIWHGVVVFDNKMWVLGGASAGSIPHNDVWHSTDGKNWTEAEGSVGWSARQGHTSVIFDKEIWVLGGLNSNDCINDVWHTKGLGVEESPQFTVCSPQLQVFPNPATTKTSIKFRVQSPEIKDKKLSTLNSSTGSFGQLLTLKIYDLSGRLVRSLTIHDAGLTIHEVTWDRRDSESRKVNSGIYFYRLNYNDLEIKGKFVILN